MEGCSVLVPAPNLGSTLPPLSIIRNLRSPLKSVFDEDAGRMLLTQDLSEYRLTVPEISYHTVQERPSSIMKSKTPNQLSQHNQRSGFSTEAWRIQNANFMEVMEKEVTGPITFVHSKTPKILKPPKDKKKSKKKYFTPKAFTLGGKRIEPVHSDDPWFLEHLLRIFATIFFAMTLPFSLMFCFKASSEFIISLNSIDFHTFRKFAIHAF